MAQQTRSIRTYTTVTSPPSSPRHREEKKHHSRRKSGKEYETVKEKKSSSRPAVVSRKTAPYLNTKSTSSGRGGRERDEEETRGRDSGESFPQFCMTCEKQFLPANNTFLYCSETCRLHDQSSAPTSTSSSHRNSTTSYSYTQSPPLTPYTRHLSTQPTHDEGPDIIPRFSPTQSRPRSYFNSDPYPSSSTSASRPSSIYAPNPLSTSPAPSSSALESLRELAEALPKPSSRSRTVPESPPKSSASSMSRTGSGVWNYIPFTSSGSKTSTPTPSQTPGNSYNGYGYAGYNVSQSYGGKEGVYGTGAGYTQSGASGLGGAGYTSSGGMGMDRPLPPRSGPGGYGHRPKSIDLVTPFGGH